MSGQGLAGFFAAVAMICAIASKSCTSVLFIMGAEAGKAWVGCNHLLMDPSCPAPGGSELAESAFGYFITACMVIILTILCYLALPRLVSTRKKLCLQSVGRGSRALDPSANPGDSTTNPPFPCLLLP